MFKRRSNTDPAPTQASPSANGSAPEARPAGKGRPTPKRSEVEQRRRQPYTPPAGDRKTGAVQDRQRRRAERVRRMEAMRKGEEWALAPKDKGPVRKFARDYVDTHRTIGEYYIFVAFALLFLLVVSGRSKTSASQSAIAIDVALGLLVVLLAEAWYHGNRVLRQVRQRFPGQSTRGVRMYTAMRGLQYRKMRMPPPRVNRGDKI